MKIERVSILASSFDPEDDNVDVYVKLEDQREYIVVVATAKNISTLMKKEGKPYLEPGCPLIIVEKLTPEVIESVLIEYAEDDAYWLKLYHIAGSIETETMDQLIDTIDAD